MQKRDRNFQFVELTMAVILGVLLVETPAFFLLQLSFSNYRAVLMVTTLLIFLELYVVLVRYHQTLEVEYAPYFFFVDLGLGLMFISFVQILKSSWDRPALSATATVVMAVIMVLLAVRQLFTYHGIQALDSRLETANLRKRDLWIPVIGNLGSVAICAFIFLSLRNGTFLAVNVVGWSWVAFFAFVIYFVFVHVLKAEFRMAP